MSSRFAIAAAAALLACSSSFAQPALDAEANGPTLWRVVLQAEKHPLLTPAFRDQIRRDLVAALQPALGPLGTVEVIDLEDALAGKADPVVQDFHSKGFAALDGPRDLTGVKTHFLKLEIRDGQFHLESRQHDGFTGLSSPTIRKQSVRAAELVGRTAGLMIERDFGLTGTLDPAKSDATEVTVQFRGGKIAGGDTQRFVKVGDVFALNRIKKAANRTAPPPARTATGKVIAPPAGSTPPAALTPEAHSFTYLRVTAMEPGGVARCAVIRSPNFKSTLPGGVAVQGYRCMKLNTIQAPISVRIVSGSDGSAATTPVANVRATEAVFNPKDDARDYLDFQNGLYRSSRPFSNIACVTIALGKTKSEFFPVPVLNADPVTLRFELNPAAEAEALFVRQALAISSRAADSRIAQNAAFEGISKLIGSQKNADALARAHAAFQAADASDKVLSEELEQLKSQETKLPGAAALFTNVDRQLKSLRDANIQLAATIKELDRVVEKEKDPRKLAGEVRAESLAARVNLLLAGGEVEEALAVLDQLATLQPNSAEVKARREKLAAEWKPKDEQHGKEREYMLKTWPALATVGDLKDSLARLRTAIDACKKAGDKHAFRRYLGILGGFPAKLTDLVKDLDPNADSVRKTLEDAKIVRELVAKIEQEVVEFLKKE